MYSDSLYIFRSKFDFGIYIILLSNCMHTLMIVTSSASGNLVVQFFLENPYTSITAESKAIGIKRLKFIKLKILSLQTVSSQITLHGAVTVWCSYILFASYQLHI